MTPAQLARLGLTDDPSETGVVHDCYLRSAGGPYYLTRAELRAVERRAVHRDRHDAIPDATLRAMAPPPERGLRIARRPPAPKPSFIPGMTMTVTCIGCGARFVRPAGGRGSRRTYCADACRDRAAQRRYQARKRRYSG